MLKDFVFRDKRLTQQVGFVAFGSFLSAALGLISLKVLSHMGPKEFGALALILTGSSFVNMLLFGPLDQIFLRFYFFFQTKGVPSLSSSSVLLAYCYFLA